MKLDFATYKNKVHGGWIGKCAGGILGAPIECIKAFNDIPLTDDLFAVNYPNDDLDLQLLWLDMVKLYGANVRESDFAAHWKKHVGFPWNEYGIATRNIKCGLLPPFSGAHNNYYWNASMGCPIRSEIWGMLSAGNPKLAARYAKMDASLDHHGFSVEAEQFLSACAAIAFFESDIENIFKKAMDIFDEQNDVIKLVNDVISWWKKCSYPVAMSKIKSQWGDADFTSAPMNVGFTLLALLHNGKNFEGVMDALHLRHDSDCVAATAGALIGIINGYESIPDNWKTLVGNEVVISAEVIGIDAPKSITDLAEQTCRAAIPFLTIKDDLDLTGDWPLPYPVSKKEYHFISTIENDVFTFSYENLTSENQRVEIELSSKHIRFEQSRFQLNLKPEEKISGNTKSDSTENEGTVINYDCLISINNAGKQSISQGLPGYGSYILLGTFIHHDLARISAHDEYPEHGLSSLPSVDYMNHDGLDMREEFIDIFHPETYLNETGWRKYPFLVQKISPDDFRINFSNYYYGKGERVVYLSSTIACEADNKKWFCIGSTAPFQFRINNELLYEKKHTSRSRIGDNILVADLKKDLNHLLIKVGLITDDNIFEIGIKEFTGKHPHQEQWALMVPTLPAVALVSKKTCIEKQMEFPAVQESVYNFADEV